MDSKRTVFTIHGVIFAYASQIDFISGTTEYAQWLLSIRANIMSTRIRLLRVEATEVLLNISLLSIVCRLH